MVRDTSISAYYDLINDEALGKRHKIIFEALILANKDMGAITTNELYADYLRKSGLANANISTRLGELRDMGAIEERAKRKCGITGHTVMTWHFTGRKPEKVNRIAKSVRKSMVKDYMAVMLTEASNPKTKEDIKILWKMVREL